MMYRIFWECVFPNCRRIIWENTVFGQWNDSKSTHLFVNTHTRLLHFYVTYYCILALWYWQSGNDCLLFRMTASQLWLPRISPCVCIIRQLLVHYFEHTLARLLSSLSSSLKRGGDCVGKRKRRKRKEKRGKESGGGETERRRKIRGKKGALKAMQKLLN